LLKKWDGKRNIERDQVYKKLSLKRKEDLLSRLAFDTFDKGEYFFKQSTAERYIADYICNIPGASDDDLQLDSEAVLRSIMAQHGLFVERAKGIFSFSHLTFHEYFAAKRIVDSSIAQGVEAFQKLASHAQDKRWGEVLFLVLGMLPDASSCVLTIQREIDEILAGDQRAQEYLIWVDEKNKSINKVSTTNTYLFYLHLHIPVSIDLDLYLDHNLNLKHNHSFNRNLYIYLNKAIESSIELGCNIDFVNILQDLRQQLPEKSAFSTWKEQYLTDWRQQLNAAMIQYCSIGHDWQFDTLQKNNLNKYYFANKLLQEFLQAEDECYLTLTTRQYVTDTFCRPFDLIPPPPPI
jgi:predicted NACHT family NTPase